MELIYAHLHRNGSKPSRAASCAIAWQIDSSRRPSIGATALPWCMVHRRGAIGSAWYFTASTFPALLWRPSRRGLT